VFTKRFAEGALGRGKTIRVTRRLVNGLTPIVEYSFVDLGAGIGTCVKMLRDTGRDGYGIDGIEGVEVLSGGLVKRADLSKPLPDTFKPMMTVICTEVGEHVPPEFAQVFLDNVVKLARSTVVLSWAQPGRSGTGHVNCQEPKWVCEQLMQRGFAVDPTKSQKLQETAGRGWNGKLWVARRIASIEH
jgi:hypothetical protein